MGIKEANRYRMRQDERLAKKENRKPNAKLEKVAYNKRITQESLEKLGKQIAWGISNNPHENSYYDDGR